MRKALLSRLLGVSVVAVALLGLFATLLPHAAVAQQAEETDPPKLTKYTSRFYEIHTDLPREEGAKFARHMDIVFAEYAKRFSNFRQRRRDPMPLYLFKTQEGYMRFLASKGIDATNSAGMFVVYPTTNGLFVFTTGRPKSGVLSTLQHEGFHQFAYAYIGPHLPIWVNEGMAQYFQDGILVGNRMEIGIPNEYRLRLVKEAIKQGNEIPFDQLLNITSAQWGETLRTNPYKAQLLYAQSWSVVYFLVHGGNGRYRPAFETFLEQLNKGRTADKAFEQAFGTSDTKAFEKRWREYLDSVKPNPINQAVERMEVLGQGLLAIKTDDNQYPQDIETLKNKLIEAGFTAVRDSHGVSVTYDAKDETLYTYPMPNGAESKFRLLTPERAGQPPRIIAQGLSPQPTLQWNTDDNGKLVSEISYR